MSGLLTAKEVCERLNISRWTFRRWNREINFGHQFEVTRPIGYRRYSAERVARYMAGESAAKFGRGSRA